MACRSAATDTFVSFVYVRVVCVVCVCVGFVCRVVCSSFFLPLTMYVQGTDVHKAAVVGDTVGDPLKDTSGPALNILMKLMAILSLVFAEYFWAINEGRGLFNVAVVGARRV